MTKRLRCALLALPVLLTAGCGSDDSKAPHSDNGRPRAGTRSSSTSGKGFPGGGDRADQAAAVPIEVAVVERRDISSYIETNGILEAENEVDIVARMSGPLVALQAEEGMTVRRGRLLARIDDMDVRSSVEIARVALEEARLNHERAKKLHDTRLISPEEFEQATTRLETAEAQYENNRILLGYTEITAPFSGRIVSRYVDLAQQVSPGTALFRISDFDPLLCPIQVPERELRRLEVGQDAYVTVEAWPGARFAARVLRISPVIDAATGTIKVTLDVTPDERLRPGMFARVFLETERRTGTLVIPKAALSLESLGDTVYVAAGSVAQRRDVTLGFREGDFVEVVAGLADGERVVVVGQDGLSDGTPIQALDEATDGGREASRLAGVGDEADSQQETEPATGPGFDTQARPGRMDPSQMSPEELERAREFMRARGLSEQEIDMRLSRRDEPAATGGDPSDQ
ncbi:MAG: efflux RND transporter periplasmic adaptor subunit [Acidobacteriota bacterium]|nr:efflux RND transporter periplasmic adaptor subunit [Acidobacteriota bacterium]